MRWLKLLFAFLFFSPLFSLSLLAQNITGIWQGYFITSDADQYKLEIQVQQAKSKSATGVSYSYLSTVFYGKATVVGNINTATKKALLQEIKTVELRMSGAGSVACIMKYNLTYTRSGNEETLQGTYTSTYEKQNDSLGIQRGGNCGGGTVFLKKVQSSDFYVEPFLRRKPSAIAAKKPVKKTTVKGATPKPSAPAAKAPKKNTTVAPPVKNKIVINPPRRDTVKTTPPVKETPKSTTNRPLFKPPVVTRDRQNELQQTITVRSKEITIRLYDNGEVDGDTVSVYVNNKLVLANKMLKAAPINLTLQVSEEEPEVVVVMVAENLGRIPPNTALMIVQDGDERYEVRTTATEQKNAMVRFRYQK